jgi:hypothetical protein
MYWEFRTYGFYAFGRLVQIRFFKAHEKNEMIARRLVHIFLGVVTVGVCIMASYALAENFRYLYTNIANSS